MKNKLVKYALYLALILFPLGNILRFGFGNGLFIIVNDVLTLFLFISVIVAYLNKPRIIFKAKLTKPIMIFAGVGLLSLAVNLGRFDGKEIAISSLYLARWVAYSSFYFGILTLNKHEKKIIFRLMIYAGSVMVGLGLVQYLLYPNLRNLYYIGWDEHLNRMFGSFLDPNFAGAFFVLFMILISPFAYVSLLRKERKSIFYVLLLTASFFSLILTYSRSALLMLISSVFFFGVLMASYFRTSKKIIFGLASLVILLVVAGVIFSPRAFKTENTNLLRTSSIIARRDSAKEALNIIKENSVLGVGFNTYRYSKIDYGFKEKNLEDSNSGAGTDNSFLFILATTGAFGFVAYLYLTTKILRLGLDNLREGLLGQILVVSVLGLLVSSLSINSLFYIFFMEWLWILAGFTENQKSFDSA